MKQNLALEEAQELLLEQAAAPEATRIALADALGRVLSQDIIAPADVPFFDRSPLDGYALSASDTTSASPSRPARLRVLEEVAAGYVAATAVVSGTAVKVMTGAPMPAGADVVIKYEEVQREGEFVSVFQPVKAGSNIVYSGEDMKKGELIAEQGTVVTPPLIGLLSGFGMTDLPVYRQIKAAILSTGDELLNDGEPLQPGKIYDSNRHVLAARCKELGIIPIALPTVRDITAAVAEQILAGLAQADLVITTGGVSVGDYDVVKDALRDIGAETIFWKVDMKPGSPIMAGIKDRKLIIGLSGNPVAALLTFDLLVVPLLKKMLGRSRYLYSRLSGMLADSYKKSSDKRRFLRGCVGFGNGGVVFRLTGIQNNSALKSMLECNVLIDVPAGSGPLRSGDHVSAVVIGDINA